ncbi:hypothetical protein J6V85_01655 [Candidatus Saccharibacteria bacterium]|nr:hypothetical protein [Candidatus Saccharibacteria bacterium]
MKKTQKKVLGFLGLALVATMTIFAAVLPNPEALAASSVTDTIVVRVLAGSPDVNIDKPSSGSAFVTPTQTINFDYSKADDVLVTMEKEMPSGSPQVYTLYEGHPSQAPGSDSVALDLSNPLYGYGDYTVHIRGTSNGGLVDEDTVRFSYLPVTATVEEDDTGKVEAVLSYDDNNEDLDHFVINVYDQDGNLVTALSPIVVDRPTKRVEIPFADKKIPAGKYTVSVAAYNTSDELIYKSYDFVFVYDPVGVPNTGSLFRSLNISQADYLITGLIVFFTVGIAGLIVLTKEKRTGRK